MQYQPCVQTRRQAAKGATTSKKRAAEDGAEDKEGALNPAASPAKRLKTGAHSYVICSHLQSDHLRLLFLLFMSVRD